MITEKLWNRMQRQERILNKAYAILPWLRYVSLVVGIVWFFVLPVPEYSRNTYISESALLPGLPYTRFRSENADWVVEFTAELDTLLQQNKGADAIKRVYDEFNQLGFTTGEQHVDPRSSSDYLHQPAVNVYGILDGQRADHAEALVLAAPWFSITGRSNARGIAMMLAIAKVFKDLTMWAKDVVFVIPAGEQGQIDWLSAYHNTTVKVTEISVTAIES
ncbi:Gaa1-like protein [Syncephalis fuscata]|nr:Gaa1-like protein [Syncephalis fuscata]